MFKLSGKSGGNDLAAGMMGLLRVLAGNMQNRKGQPLRMPIRRVQR